MPGPGCRSRVARVRFSPFSPGGRALITSILWLGKALVLAIERAAPRHPHAHGAPRRWAANLGLFAANLLLLRMLLPAGASAWSAYEAETSGLGLLNAFPAPPLVGWLVTFAALDLFQWGQHWVQHRVPIFWRFHQVHHTDLDVDLTTGFRTHPLEALVQVLGRSILVLALGLPLIAVLAFEIALEVVGFVAHASLRIPRAVDAVARRLLVTPDFHRVHHSVFRDETDSNYGGIFSFWDRLFRTCHEQPRKGHLDMEIGLLEYREARGLNALQLLALPFRRQRSI